LIEDENEERYNNNPFSDITFFLNSALSTGTAIASTLTLVPG